MNPEKPDLPRDPRKKHIVGPSLPGLSDWEENIDSKKQAAELLGFIVEGLNDAYIKLRKGSRILDVGSGTGEFVAFLNKKGFKAVGIDLRPRHEKRSPIAVARVEQLPFADGTFDAVVSSSVFDSEIYHQDQDRMMGEIARVLKPDGIFASYAEKIEAQTPSLTMIPERFPGPDGYGLKIFQRN